MRIGILIALLSGLTLAQDFDSYLAKEAAARRFSGTVLVARDGKVLFAKGYGMANLELDVPNKAETKFRLGSVTKQFAAAAILKLEEAGKLKVEDLISKYIDGCPEAWSKITIHHLLSHTSGIHNFTNDADYPKSWMLPSRPQETMKRFRDKPLEFQPGEKWQYSNSGYILLAVIIEKASGMKYEDYLRQTIFDPLGMKDSGTDAWEPILKNRATGYTLRGGQWVNAPYHDMTIPIGGGDLYSTVLDLVKWDQALYGTALLAEASKAKMFQPVKENYGYGWAITTWEGRKVIEHGGGINGFSTSIKRFPEDRTLVVVLGNADFLRTGAIGNTVSRIAFGLPVTSATERKEVSLAPEKLKEYVGVYQIEGAPVTVTMRLVNGALTTQMTGQQQIPVFAEGEDRFFLKVVDAQIVFERNGTGAVTKLTIHQNGRKIPATLTSRETPAN
ncbi:MAG: serine hydrolase [Bryobacter sp.]|nr:serine hydrolase [Bryobacter sp.]